MAKKKSKTSASKQAKQTAPKSNKKLWIGLAVILAVSAFAFFQFSGQATTASNKRTGPIGPLNLCKNIPPIAKKRGLQDPLMIDLRQVGYDGLRIIEAKENGKILQLNEWSSAGHLGPYSLDKMGNIYVAPVPHVSLEVNKPEDQNRILKVDGQTGKMLEFKRFPRPEKTNHNNPFGVMGLAYDCESESIYASSIAGSGFKQELGVIYQVDLATKEVISSIENIDAIGISVYRTKTGKRLFYGSARTPEVFSIALDEDGKFVGQPRFELSLAAQHGGSADRAHRIRFSQDRKMEVKGIEFSYSLLAASDPMRNVYNFAYDANTDQWIYKSVYRQ